MAISKLSNQSRLALYALVLGIGAQLAPATSIASSVTACLNACGAELRICKEEALGNPDSWDASCAVVACFDEWGACTSACYQ